MGGWEGVLNPTARRAEASVSGEAPAASLPEGVLNPINCLLSQGKRIWKSPCLTT